MSCHRAMTDLNQTARALSQLTDQGLFERLATAVLREANPLYATLTHSGINADGKTIRGPVDGIAIHSDGQSQHLIAVHHTVSARDELRRKWLSGSNSVPVKGPPGDLQKTASIYTTERSRIPGLNATLVLTTIHEPTEDLVRDVHAAGLAVGINIDLWPRSRITHFLDVDPKGQWLRRTFLGIDQEQLSPELLRELSVRSLECHRPAGPPDEPMAWVGHRLDKTLAEAANRDITFVVAESGLGKSVACYKRLKTHVERGGFGLVLPHDVVRSAVNLEQALETALRQLCPSLALGCVVQALQYASSQDRLLLVVEDVNRSGEASLLVEKLAAWSNAEGGQAADARITWNLLCPVWPRVLASLGEQSRKRVAGLAVTGVPFTAVEARSALLR
jgi:hypothetical protein